MKSFGEDSSLYWLLCIRAWASASKVSFSMTGCISRRLKSRWHDRHPFVDKNSENLKTEWSVMPTAKARYTGGGGRAKTKEFSSSLKTKLRDYFPRQQLGACEIWGHPADDFVSHVLAEAQWAVSELYWQTLDITKSEIRAEQQDLLHVLKLAHGKLRKLSPDIDRLLGVDADPLGCADKIQDLILHTEYGGGSSIYRTGRNRPKSNITLRWNWQSVSCMS